jgi:hypothetical protein
VSGKSRPAVWRDAIRDSGLDPTSRHVAHALSTWMDAQGFCYPGREKIAAGTGFSVRTVERAVQRLEAGGWLRVERGTGHRSNRYHALLSIVASESRHNEWPAATTESRSGDADDHSGDTGVARKRLKRESGAPTAAAPLSGSASSARTNYPEDDCESCGLRTAIVDTDRWYCAECLAAVSARPREGPQRVSVFPGPKAIALEGQLTIEDQLNHKNGGKR